LASFAPSLNDKYNSNCKKCEERGTGKQWIDNNFVKVEDWEKKRDEHLASVQKRTEDHCSNQFFKPKLEKYYQVTVFK